MKLERFFGSAVVTVFREDEYRWGMHFACGCIWANWYLYGCRRHSPLLIAMQELRELKASGGLPC